MNARAIHVEFSDAFLVIRLSDGCRLHVPLERFPKLRDATPANRADWRLIGNGVGVHWAALDEDIQVRELLTPEIHHTNPA
jgi:hypothetical protein